MWFDLIAAKTPPGKIDQQLSAVLTGLWKALKMEQQFRPAPTTARAPHAPAEASRIQLYCGWVPPMSMHRMQDMIELPPGEGHCGRSDQRPHIEFTIHWHPRNKQKVMVNTGAKCTLIHGNPGIPWVFWTS